MNKVILIGNLVRDVELEKTASGIIFTRFSIAVNNIQDTTFIDCVAWRNNAENLGKYCKKGSKISIVGRLDKRSYEAKDGSKRYVTEVVCDEIEYLNTRKVEEQPKQTRQPELTQITLTDDSLPF